MPRKRPAALRAAIPRRREIRESRAHLRGISGKVVADIVRLERRNNQLWPGDISRAFQGWIRIARGPMTEFLDDFGGCPCGCTKDYRDVLEIALRSLPRQAARELRCLVDATDQLFISRTLPDLWADPHDPWWKQRM